MFRVDRDNRFSHSRAHRGWWISQETVLVSARLQIVRQAKCSFWFVAGSLIVFDPAAKAPYVYSPGDIAWVLASTVLVWIMVPGIGFFYSGLLRWILLLQSFLCVPEKWFRRKNALSMIYLSMMTLAVVSFQVRLFLSFNASEVIQSCAVVFLGLFTHIQWHWKLCHRRFECVVNLSHYATLLIVL